MKNILISSAVVFVYAILLKSMGQETRGWDALVSMFVIYISMNIGDIRREITKKKDHDS